jgi:AAA15 family ATPase/GTPase
LKEFTEAYKDDEGFLRFRYWADVDPSGELHDVGTILAGNAVSDINHTSSGSPNAEYWGSANIEPNTRSAFEAAKNRLIQLGWTFRKRPFIQEIYIKKIRHLRDIKILIDEDRPRHLILTGPNGSGKTSLLTFLRSYLEGIPSRMLLKLDAIRANIENYKGIVLNLKTELNNPQASEQMRTQLPNQIIAHQQQITMWKQQIADFETMTIKFFDFSGLVDAYHRGEFIIAFFQAKRTSDIQNVNGVQKINVPAISPIMPSGLSSIFLQYLVNQENRAAMLYKKHDDAGVEAIDKWKANIIKRLRDLFNNQTLELVYDIDKFDFTVQMEGREPFRLVNELSDGYSSVINIIAELILRMEAIASGQYDMPGIVLIDEIETHLHIELQKHILPFLTSFFPNIQFIVSSHSPFVLTSLPDSVVFDLEKQKRWECISPLSAGVIIEDYFESDLYSTESKEMIARYSELSTGSRELSSDEQLEYEILHRQLDAIDFNQAPELKTQYEHIQAMRKQG